MSAPQKYDVLVVGGGIHGAGVAQACAANGYSVLLVEQNVIASATSQKSSKLIHGGLRYLESGQFSLVRECLVERKCLLKNAPKLVTMKPFYLPIYRKTTRRPWQIRLGLSLYALLSGLARHSFFKKIPKSQWHRLNGLTTRDLDAVYQYWDAQTDDRLLTEAVIRSAKSMGAIIKEKTALLGGNFNENEWLVQLSCPENQINVRANVVVNAGGPWVNHVLQKINPQETGLDVDLVQGTHIVLDTSIAEEIYYVESPEDRRAVFIMPWYGRTLVGTTEKSYDGDPVDVAPTEEEVAYLQSTVRHYFPSVGDIEQKTVSRFAGLRVLPRQAGAAFSRPRETTIHTDSSGRCFSIYGGKLTAYRATADAVLAKIQAKIPTNVMGLDTKYISL